jgi:thiamine transporter
MLNMKVSNTQRLVETAAMLGIATVLSMIKLIDLPYGGSVTIASMLPMIVIAYRYGTKWGLLAGFAFGAIQQLIGLNTLSWVTTWQSILAVVLLDYIIAFMATGLGGVFRKGTSQQVSLVLGCILVGVVRYTCHVISGATVWAGLSIPSNAALIYSLGYNATYMIPETIVMTVAAFQLGGVLDFRNENITRMIIKKDEGTPVIKWVCGLAILAALVYDVAAVFSHLQNAESGDFDITGLALVNWTSVAAVTIAAVVVVLVLMFLFGKHDKKAAPQA